LFICNRRFRAASLDTSGDPAFVNPYRINLLNAT
jgi:hypothetical protein